MPCKHAALAAIYAQQMAEVDEPWKLWQWENGSWWVNCKEHPRWKEDIEYRQIPKTIRIGNFDVPEPMRKKPEERTTYWMAESTSESGVARVTWDGGGFDKRAFDRGLCHKTQEAAIIHAKALFSFSEVE